MKLEFKTINIKKYNKEEHFNHARPMMGGIVGALKYLSKNGLNLLQLQTLKDLSLEKYHERTQRLISRSLT